MAARFLPLGHRSILVAILALEGLCAGAQEATPAAEASTPSEASAEDRDFSRDDVWRYLGPSLAVPATMDALQSLGALAPSTRSVLPWIVNPGMLLAHVPLYWLDTGKALAYTSAGLALPAAGLSLPAMAPESPFLGDASGALLGAYTNTMRFSVYQVYREARERIPDGAPYGNAALAVPFRPHGLWELLSAGFRDRAILDPLVYVPPWPARRPSEPFT